MSHLIVRVGVGLLIAVGLYLFLYRPLQLRWGASRDEVARVMPGDEIQPNPIFNATWAVTVLARPEQIWPWLIQIGYQRAGWYGYDVIDNAGAPSADRILPQWQHAHAGDTMPIWKGIDYIVAAVEEDRYVVWESKSGRDSMALALYPLDTTHTRLVWRIRNGPYNWTSSFILLQLFTDACDFLAVRQNMLGLQSRAEGMAPEASALAYGELGLWLALFVAFIVAEVGLIVRRDWARPLVATFATGLITIGLVLGRPAVWVDGFAVLAVYMGLVWIYGRPSRL